MSDDEIDKITHLNAMRHYQYDAFPKLGGRDSLHRRRPARTKPPTSTCREVAITHTPPRDPSEPPITILSIMEAVSKSGTQG